MPSEHKYRRLPKLTPQGQNSGLFKYEAYKTIPINNKPVIRHFRALEKISLSFLRMIL